MRYETDLTKVPGYIIGDIIFATRGVGICKNSPHCPISWGSLIRLIGPLDKFPRDPGRPPWEKPLIDG